MSAVAVGELANGTPVIVTGEDDGTVRVWRLDDGTPVGPPLDLSDRVQGVAVNRNTIITATRVNIAVHQALLWPIR